MTEGQLKAALRAPVRAIIHAAAAGANYSEALALLPRDRELADLLRPHVARLVAAGRSRGAALFSEFSAPGAPPRPGLVWKEQTKRWVRPDEPGGASTPGATSPAAPSAPARPAPSAADPRANPDVKRVAARAAEELADDPDARKPGVRERVARAVVDTAIAAYSVAARIQDSRIANGLAALLDAAFDSPKDMQLFGYDPTVSSGGAGPRTLDPVREASGGILSGPLAAKIAGVVVAKTLFWLKGKLKAGAQMSATFADADVHALAEALADLFDAANSAVGLPKVDRRRVLVAVARLTAGR